MHFVQLTVEGSGCVLHEPVTFITYRVFVLLPMSKAALKPENLSRNLQVCITEVQLCAADII